MLSNVHRPWRNQGKISSDACLFDEMYLQKCEEYFFVIWWTVTMKVNYTKDWFAL